VTHISALGYIGIGVRDLAAWRAYATRVLGAQVVDGTGPGGEVMYLRIDDRQYRIIVAPGDDQLRFVGWEVAGPGQFDALLGDLDAAGVAWKEDPGLAAQRGVTRLVTCSDPAGRVLEFYRGGRVVQETFVSPAGARFVTRDRHGKDLGFGHIVLTFPDLDEALEFYLGTLKFKLSDTLAMYMRPGVTATFAHVNARHHSLALLPARPGEAPSLNHFMFEVEDIDMVGRALDRVREHGITTTASLGRHINDLMLSFYMRSPSGFGVEYGCQGRLIDDEAWTTVNYTVAHLWGHQRD
jgi:3,4-dihydroxy-9,10-secoandrosta-1,3,5(10)-triene-9,17-dione 4,5-dioxygenase